MSLAGKPRGDLEFQKFCDVNGEVAVRTCTTIDGENSSIQAIPAGFKIAQKNTTVLVSDVASEIPPTPLTNRNQISIQNLSQTDTVYIGNSDVTAGSSVGTTSGWPIGPNESLNELVQDDVTYWAVTASGKTAMVIIRELA